MSTTLDWAKFGLDRFNAMVDAQVKLLKAYSDYNFRMMEVLEKRIKVETDYLKLVIMRDAFRDFRRARGELLALQRRRLLKLNRIQDNSEHVLWLARGEELPADLVKFVWIGFGYFLHAAPVDVESQLVALDVTEEHRKGCHFSHNLTPQAPCEDAPGDILHVRALIEFLRRKNYMPRMKSPPACLLATVVSLLDTYGDRQASKCEAALAEIGEELARLRAADWKTVSIDTRPREPEDVEE